MWDKVDVREGGGRCIFNFLVKQGRVLKLLTSQIVFLFILWGKYGLMSIGGFACVFSLLYHKGMILVCFFCLGWHAVRE